MMTGREEDFQASLARLPEVTPARGAEGWMSLLFAAGIFLLDHLGRIAQATALEEPFLALIKQRGDQSPLTRLWWHVSFAQREFYAHDDPWNALVHSVAIQPIADLIGGDVMCLSMQLMVGSNLWLLGALAPAAQVLEAIPVADTTLGEQSSLRRIALAWVYADRGALDEARAAATAVREACREHHDHLGAARATWVLAEVLRRTGDLDGAEREIDTARAMALPLDQPGMLATLAMLRLAQGRPADALAVAEDAMARCSTMVGGCGLFRSSAVRLAHAEALHATGAADAARQAIADARTRLFAVAHKIPDAGRRASFLEQVPENARTLALAAAWLGDAAPSPAGPLAPP
jgi:tetratricopeptide (TPR) repeat protein